MDFKLQLYLIPEHILILSLVSRSVFIGVPSPSNPSHNFCVSGFSGVEWRSLCVLDLPFQSVANTMRNIMHI